MKILLLTILCSVTFMQCAKRMSPNNIVPAAIQKKIDELKNQPVQNPPASIYRYDYNGEQVYYLPAPCCDQFSSLLNSKGELICYPDGGFTGKGDGKCSDFTDKRTNEVLIWKDDRAEK